MTHEELTSLSTRLEEWYGQHARGLLEETAPDRLEGLDGSIHRLASEREAISKELPICFLGNSGVGKSTLLNALVAERLSILPQGGVGPLTAQATVVRYADEPNFRATYHPRARLNNLLFALERSYEADLRRQGKSTPAPDVATELDEDARFELEVASDSGDDSPGAEGDRMQGYKRQAALMLLGDQFAEPGLPHLIDGLRACLGREPQFDEHLDASEKQKIERIRGIVSLAQDSNHFVEHRAGENLPAFLGALEEHASGFLAPLIRTLDVSWNAEFMRGGLVLVDLPGVGVANDQYRQVTTGWIRRARAVVLVVDRSGVTEAGAELLRSTGFFNSLLHDAHDPSAVPTSLMVCGVKLDLVASDDRQRQKQTNPGVKPDPWQHHFDAACVRFTELIRGQVHTELQKIVDEGADETREARERAVAQVLGSLQIHPVSAPEYRKAIEADEDDPPKVKSPKQSRIPRLRDAMQAVSANHQARVLARSTELVADTYRKSRTAVSLVKAQWEEHDRAAEEAQRLRFDLERFISPLSDQFKVRQGEFRRFLRKEIPTRIEDRVEVAAAQAEKVVSRYIRKLKGVHWATLRAAVRRGGTFVGSKHVDLPNELTLRMEEPIAVIWSKDILSALRKETRDMGSHYVRLIGEVVDWARGEGERVRPALVEALHESLRAETKDLGNVGKEAIDELKENVRTQLFDDVEKVVRRKCQQFVREQADRGAGVKARMHEFLETELAEEVVEVAKPIAMKVLLGNYREVDSEIAAVLKKYPNPLQSATDAIVGDHEQRVRRSDAQKRKRILSRADEALNALPELPESMVEVAR